VVKVYAKKELEEAIKNLKEEDITRIIEEVKATQAIEGLEVTEEEKEIMRKYLQGQLTEVEVLKIIQER
jgi:type I restriction-modification system DNA methylase subunit